MDDTYTGHSRFLKPQRPMAVVILGKTSSPLRLSANCTRVISHFSQSVSCGVNNVAWL